MSVRNIEQALVSAMCVGDHQLMRGAEVLDLTDRANVALIRRWKQDDRAYLDILRYVRISSQDPLRLLVSRPGKHQNLQQHASTTINSPIAAAPVIEDPKMSSNIQGADIIP